MRGLHRELYRFLFRAEMTDLPDIFEEGARRSFPGMFSGKRETGVRGNGERGQACCPQVVAQRADRRVADHIARPGHGKGRYRQAARKGFQQNQTKVSVLLGNTKTSAAA